MFCVAFEQDLVSKRKKGGEGRDEERGGPPFPTHHSATSLAVSSQQVSSISSSPVAEPAYRLSFVLCCNVKFCIKSSDKKFLRDQHKKTTSTVSLQFTADGRRGGLMVSTPDPGSSSYPGFEARPEHCVVFLDKTVDRADSVTGTNFVFRSYVKFQPGRLR